MKARIVSVHHRLASLPAVGRILQAEKFWRYVAVCLATDVVAYGVVLVLATSGGMGKLAANEVVSFCVAPAGLFLNSLALTRRLKPTASQAAKWAVYWPPSFLLGGFLVVFVALNFGLGPMETRAVAGLMLFPCDYLVKRYVIFSRQVWLSGFFNRMAPVTPTLSVLAKFGWLAADPKTETV